MLRRVESGSLRAISVLREASDERARHDAALRVEHFDNRVERRAELLGRDLEHELLPFAAVKRKRS